MGASLEPPTGAALDVQPETFPGETGDHPSRTSSTGNPLLRPSGGSADQQLEDDGAETDEELGELEESGRPARDISKRRTATTEPARQCVTRSVVTPGAETDAAHEGDPLREYVFEKILDHGYAEDDELLLKVHWEGHPRSDATWEPVSSLPRSKFVQYFRRRKLPLL